MSKKLFFILCLFSAVFSNTVFSQQEKSPLLQIEQNGKTGYIDKTGRIIIPPQFDYGWKFSEGFACVVVDGKTGFIDESGKYLVKPQFNSTYAGCYDEFHEGFASISTGDWRKIKGKRVAERKWGFVDTKGNVAFLPGVTLLYEFREDLVGFEKGKLKGYMDANLNVVIEPKFKSAGSFYFGRARVTDIDGHEYYIDKTGQKVFDNHNGGEFQDGKAFFVINGKYGFINTDGSTIVEPQFRQATHFGEGLAGIKIGKKWGFIDETGKLIIEPQFDAVGVFSEGLVSVAINDKWGFIDKTGTIVIPPQFDKWTYWFEDGICGVRIDGKLGYIDKSGKFIWLPSK